MVRVWGCLWAGLLLSSSVALAVPFPMQKLVLLDLSAKGVPKDTAQTLSEIMLSRIRETAPGVTVIGQSEIEAMLALEAQKDLLGCSDETSCLAEIGGALGADHLVNGSIGKLGSVFLINMKLLNTVEARVVNHVSERIDGGEELLIEAVDQLAANLVDTDKPTNQAYITINETGLLRVDGQSAGMAPVIKKPLRAGTHVIELANSDGDLIFSRSANIAPYTNVLVEAPKMPPAPVAALSDGGGSSWWIWALGGVAVVGATGAVIALTGGDPNKDGSTSSGQSIGNIVLDFDKFERQP
jgi:hypothetical protein